LHNQDEIGTNCAVKQAHQRSNTSVKVRTSADIQKVKYRR